MPDEKDVLGSLSPEQLRKLRIALDEHNAGSSKLSDEEVRRLEGEVKKYHDAQRQVTEGLGVLWNAHLDMLIKTRDPHKIGSAIMRPGGEVAFYDNCDCHPPPGPKCW